MLTELTLLRLIQLIIFSNYINSIKSLLHMDEDEDEENGNTDDEDQDWGKDKTEGKRGGTAGRTDVANKTPQEGTGEG